MNREEFIKHAETLSEEQLKEQVTIARKRAEARIPEETTKLFRSLDEVTEVQELHLNTGRYNTRLYLVKETGAEENLSVLVNIHGGGWSLPHGERDIFFSRRMAHRLHCLVIDVDYVLAPEYPYPAAIEELEDLLNAVPEVIGTYGGDPDRIAICGQSSGGNLAAAVLQRKNVKTKICGALLCYLPGDNYTNRFGDDDLTPRDIDTEYYGFYYNRNFEDRRNSDVSLIFASEDELKHFPRTDIMVCGLDSLKDEGIRYYDLLVKSGVKTNLKCFENSRHGFLINLYDEWQEGEDCAVKRIGSYFE